MKTLDISRNCRRHIGGWWVVFFLLLALTGCIEVPSRPAYTDTSQLVRDAQKAEARPASPLGAYSLGLIVSDNARKMVDYLGKLDDLARAFGTDYSSEGPATYLIDQTLSALKSRFRKVVEVKAAADAAAQGLDLVVVLDIRAVVGTSMLSTTTAQVSGVFMDADGAVIDTITGNGETRSTFPTARVRLRDAEDLAVKAFAEKLDGSEKLVAFAKRVAPRPEAAVAATASPAAQPAEPLGKIADRWAVVFGISRYKYADPKKLPDLKYADRDAEDFAAFLKSPAGGGFANDHVLLLTNEQATAKNIREALFEFLKHTVREDLVVIFCSGHGMPDPDKPSNLYLAAYDSDPSKIASTGFPMWDLDTALRRTIAAERVVAFVDTCHSAGATEGVKGVRVGDQFNRYFDELAKARPGRVVFTSSEGYEVSREDAKWGGGHGVFTWALLDGLKGKADADGDGIVTLGEILDYVDLAVRRETANEQHPARAGAQYDRRLPLGVVK